MKSAPMAPAPLCVLRFPGESREGDGNRPGGSPGVDLFAPGPPLGGAYSLLGAGYYPHSLPLVPSCPVTRAVKTESEQGPGSCLARSLFYLV